MRKHRKSTDRWLGDRATDPWKESSIRWLMENYDIWSATPARCPNEPARPLPFK